MNERYWFLSYVRSSGDSGTGRIIRFCSTISKGEHPIAKVNRWNREYTDQQHALIAFQEITPEEAAWFGDSDHMRDHRCRRVRPGCV